MGATGTDQWQFTRRSVSECVVGLGHPGTSCVDDLHLSLLPEQRNQAYQQWTNPAKAETQVGCHALPLLKAMTSYNSGARPQTSRELPVCKNRRHERVNTPRADLQKRHLIDGRAKGRQNDDLVAAAIARSGMRCPGSTKPEASPSCTPE